MHSGTNNPTVIAMDPSGEAIPMNKQNNFYKDPSSKLIILI